MDGTSTLKDTVTVTAGGLDVTGGTTADTLTVDGTSTLKNTVSITAGGLDVSGGTTTDTFKVNGISTMNGALSITDGGISADTLSVANDAFKVVSSGECTGNTINGTSFKGGTFSGSSFTTTSDYRIKENIMELNDLFTVDHLKPVTYINKQTNTQDIGFIAHEVQSIFPYLVKGEKNSVEFQSLNYTGLIGVLVKEIQDLKQRVSELEKI